MVEKLDRVAPWALILRAPVTLRRTSANRASRPKMTMKAIAYWPAEEISIPNIERKAFPSLLPPDPAGEAYCTRTSIRDGRASSITNGRPLHNA